MPTSVAKITEITAESPESFDHAIRTGIERASRTLKNLRSVWVKDHEISIANNKPERFRVTLKVTFVLED
jgi:flavin-binding protein dodecin